MGSICSAERATMRARAIFISISKHRCRLGGDCANLFGLLEPTIRAGEHRRSGGDQRMVMWTTFAKKPVFGYLGMAYAMVATGTIRM